MKQLLATLFKDAQVHHPPYPWPAAWNMETSISDLEVKVKARNSKASRENLGPNLAECLTALCCPQDSYVKGKTVEPLWF